MVTIDILDKFLGEDRITLASGCPNDGPKNCNLKNSTVEWIDNSYLQQTLEYLRKNSYLKGNFINGPLVRVLYGFDESEEINVENICNAIENGKTLPFVLNFTLRNHANSSEEPLHKIGKETLELIENKRVPDYRVDELDALLPELENDVSREKGIIYLGPNKFSETNRLVANFGISKFVRKGQEYALSANMQNCHGASETNKLLQEIIKSIENNEYYAAQMITAVDGFHDYHLAARITPLKIAYVF